MSGTTPTPTPSLAERVVRGDRRALAELMRRHLTGLHAFVRLRAGPRIRAQESCSDLVQSVCREVLEDLDRYEFETEGAFRYWLYQAAERKVLDRARYWARERRDPERERPLEAGGDGDLSVLYSSISSPSAGASLREEIERLESSFDLLSQEHREVIVLSHIVGLSRGEIGRMTDRSEEAVSSLLYRAMSRLSTVLRGADPEGGPIRS